MIDMERAIGGLAGLTLGLFIGAGLLMYHECKNTALALTVAAVVVTFLLDSLNRR